MSPSIGSTLKRMGSKKSSSDKDSVNSSSRKSSESSSAIRPSKSGSSGAPPAIPAPMPPNKGTDSSGAENVVPLKTPGGGPQAMKQSTPPASSESKQQAPVTAKATPQKSTPQKAPSALEAAVQAVAQAKAVPTTPSSVPEIPTPKAAQPSIIATPASPDPQRQLSPDPEETPLEIKTVGGKSYVFHQRPNQQGSEKPNSATQSPTTPTPGPSSTKPAPVSAAAQAASATNASPQSVQPSASESHSKPKPTPARRQPGTGQGRTPSASRSTSPHSSSPRNNRHPYFVESKHSQSHSISGRPLSRSSSRVTLHRTSSMAQVARDHKSHPTNDTRHFYQQPHAADQHLDARPSLSRKNSYAEDKRAMEYISSKSSDRTAENSNLIFRTSSRIWDAGKEDSYFGFDHNRSHYSSRRTSIASSESDASDSEENLHPSRFISRSGSFVDEDEDETEFADSLIIRATDWILGIPHDSVYTLRNSLKKKPKMLSLLDKRRLREQNIASDPAFLLAAYLSLREVLL